METPINDTPQTPYTPRPRRRRRSKWQLFKEAYLPTIILAVTVVLIIVFVIGAISDKDQPDGTKPPVGSTPAASDTQNPGSTGGTEQPTDQTQPTQTPPSQTQPVETPGKPQPTLPEELRQEVNDRLAHAKELADAYDYDAALAMIAGFSGNMEDVPELLTAYQHYMNLKRNAVSWKASDVVNLSFHVLITDTDRAYKDPSWASQYKKNFVTVSQFTNILEQLYENGYVLVSLEDFYYQEFNSSSGRYYYKEKELRLPAGKKPIMITETNANYYSYMVDPDKNGVPDKNGAGFASRLCYDGTRFYNEYVGADDKIYTGSYDVVPLLEDFIAEHPDFSYKGARAIIAFSGYDGVLGYRINSSKLSGDALQAERDGAVAIVEALKNAGYELACYTYDNSNYSTMAASKVQTDIQNWLDQIAPVIGHLDILVFAKDVDIAGTESYSGNSKFNVLYNAGFRFFVGTSKSPWNQVDEQYVRHNKINVTAELLRDEPELYEGLFDPDAVKNSLNG